MTSGERLAKRIMWLAYQASHVFGMGKLQERNDATEDIVWEHTHLEGEYSASADYVFGRMIKLRIYFNDSEIVKADRGRDPNPEYQSWYCKYKTFADLVTAAELEIEEEDRKSAVAM